MSHISSSSNLSPSDGYVKSYIVGSQQSETSNLPSTNASCKSGNHTGGLISGPDVEGSGDTLNPLPIQSDKILQLHSPNSNNSHFSNPNTDIESFIQDEGSIIISASSERLCFKEGDKIEANYKGGAEWFLGKIKLSRNDGSYNIVYDDGYKELGVSFDRIRILTSSEDAIVTKPDELACANSEVVPFTETQSTNLPSKSKISIVTQKTTFQFKKFDKVEVKYNDLGAWYPGRIVKRNRYNGSYSISYYDSYREHGIVENRIRLPLPCLFSEGTKVESYYLGFGQTGQWSPATVEVDKKDGTCDIIYDDGKKVLGVPVLLIRPLSSADPELLAVSAGRFSEGDIVEAKQGDCKGLGTWSRGKIAFDRNDGTYDIDFDDDCRELRIALSLIRLENGNDTSSTLTNFKVGDCIEARYKGLSKWYPGKISAVGTGDTYDIAYDDGDKEVGVQLLLIRPLLTHTEWAKRLKAGDKIEGNYKDLGKWYPGEIKSIGEDGTFDIAYDDGDIELKIGVDLIRARTVPNKQPLLKPDDPIELNISSLSATPWYPGKVLSRQTNGSYRIVIQVPGNSIRKAPIKTGSSGDRTAATGGNKSASHPKAKTSKVAASDVDLENPRQLHNRKQARFQADDSGDCLEVLPCGIVCIYVYLTIAFFANILCAGADMSELSTSSYSSSHQGKPTSFFGHVSYIWRHISNSQLWSIISVGLDFADIVTDYLITKQLGDNALINTSTENITLFALAIAGIMIPGNFASFIIGMGRSLDTDRNRSPEGIMMGFNLVTCSGGVFGCFLEPFRRRQYDRCGSCGYLLLGIALHPLYMVWSVIFWTLLHLTSRVGKVIAGILTCHPLFWASKDVFGSPESSELFYLSILKVFQNPLLLGINLWFMAQNPDLVTATNTFSVVTSVIGIVFAIPGAISAPGIIANLQSDHE